MVVSEREVADSEFEDKYLENDGLTADRLAEEDEHMLNENEEEEDYHDVGNLDREDWPHLDIYERLR